MSSLIKSIDSKFNDLKVAIDTDRGKWVSSQGANALILVYPPGEEKEYLKRVKNDYADQHIINISDLFVKLIDDVGIETFKQGYKMYYSSPESIFYGPDREQTDLFDLIIDEITKAREEKRIPILIRTGMLYGAHIRNKDILEHKIVNKGEKPLIIFYPGTVKKDISDKERVWFLGVQKASDYRGQLI